MKSRRSKHTSLYFKSRKSVYFEVINPPFCLIHKKNVDNKIISTHCGLVTPYKSGSTLVQVMACCLTTPSHFLNLFWLIISEILWHSHESNITPSALATLLCDEFENYTFKITAISHSGHWVTCVQYQPSGQHNHVMATWYTEVSQTQIMLTSRHGYDFRIIGPLRGECIGHLWIPPTKSFEFSRLFV